VEAVLLIIAVGLVLMAFAPVGPSRTARTGLRTRISRQLRLWDRYLLNLPGSGSWRA
jgi:hypothetical protein